MVLQKSCFNFDLKIKGFVTEENDKPVQKNRPCACPLRRFVSFPNDPGTRKDPGPVETEKVTLLDVLLLRGILAESVQCLLSSVGTQITRGGEGRKENHVNASSTQELQ